MKIKIKDENGNEEILFDNSYYLAISIALTIIGMFFGLWAFGVSGILLLLLFIFLFNWDWNERIILDKGIKSAILEEKIVIGKEFKWKEAKRIKFSDIKGIYVIERSNEAGYFYTIELIIDKYSVIELQSKNDSKSAKEFAIALCKAIGINGYYIDEKKNSTTLFEVT